jgi:hypothetical protein
MEPVGSMPARRPRVDAGTDGTVEPNPVDGDDYVTALVNHRCREIADRVVPVSVLEQALAVIEELEARMGELTDRFNAAVVARALAAISTRRGTDGGLETKTRQRPSEGFQGWSNLGA